MHKSALVNDYNDLMIIIKIQIFFTRIKVFTNMTM